MKTNKTSCAEKTQQTFKWKLFAVCIAENLYPEGRGSVKVFTHAEISWKKAYFKRDEISFDSLISEDFYLTLSNIKEGKGCEVVKQSSEYQFPEW